VIVQTEASQRVVLHAATRHMLALPLWMQWLSSPTAVAQSLPPAAVRAFMPHVRHGFVF